MRTVLVLMAWLCSASYCFAADLLLVVLMEDNGPTNIHYQATTHETCSKFLADFKNNQKRNIPTKLAFQAEPVVSGKVIEAYCVLTNGTVVDPDGKNVNLDATEQ